MKKSVLKTLQNSLENTSLGVFLAKLQGLQLKETPAQVLSC